MKKNRKKSKRRAKKTQAIVLAKPQSPVLQEQPQGIVSAATIESTVNQVEAVRRFINRCLNQQLQRALKKNPKLTEFQRRKFEVDFGSIPGSDKKILFQPGAEKICLWLHIRPEYDHEELRLPDGHLEVVVRCRLIATSTNQEVFRSPSCSCSSMESNFRYRWVKRDKDKAPDKDEASRLKAVGMGKWVPVYKNGMKVQGQFDWMDRFENPNIHDELNKVRQQGDKRALVKGVRNFGAMSEIFTEDPTEWQFADENGVVPDTEPDLTGSVTMEPPEAKPTGGGRILKKGAASPPSEGKKKMLQVMWTGNKDVARLAGDIQEITGILEKEFFAVYLKNAESYCIPVDNVPLLSEWCEKHGFEFQEVHMSSGVVSTEAKGQSSAPEAQPKPQKPEMTPPASTGADVAGGSSVPCSGKVTQLRSVKEGAQLQVLLEPKLNTAVWLFCYNQALFPLLHKAKGLIVEFMLDKRTIVGFKKIANREFMSDGVTPIIQANEDRPKPGELFA